MTDLQIGLLIIGALVVAAVYFYNLIQQRNYRRQGERAFSNRHEDVLLRPAAEPATINRLEPKLDTAASLPPEPPAATEAQVEDAPDATGGWLEPDPEIDCAAELRLPGLADADALSGFMRRKAEFGKPCTVYGFDAESGGWEEIRPGFPARYGRIKAALQVCDRSGPVSEVILAAFRDAVQSMARDLRASVELPDLQEAYVQAALLDQFCAEVDVMIGINIVARDQRPFAGSKIRALAESNGFKLAPDGRFAYQDESGRELFSLVNLEPSAFRQDGLSQLATHGVTFLLDVPRVANGETAFGHMVHLGRTFASTLGGSLVDDNRMPLTDAGMEKIRDQIRRLQATMSARQIAAGSVRALRLFA